MVVGAPDTRPLGSTPSLAIVATSRLVSSSPSRSSGSPALTSMRLTERASSKSDVSVLQAKRLPPLAGALPMTMISRLRYCGTRECLDAGSKEGAVGNDGFIANLFRREFTERQPGAERRSSSSSSAAKSDVPAGRLRHVNDDDFGVCRTHTAVTESRFDRRFDRKGIASGANALLRRRLRTRDAERETRRTAPRPRVPGVDERIAAWRRGTLGSNHGDILRPVREFSAGKECRDRCPRFFSRTVGVLAGNTQQQGEATDALRIETAPARSRTPRDRRRLSYRTL